MLKFVNSCDIISGGNTYGVNVNRPERMYVKEVLLRLWLNLRSKAKLATFVVFSSDDKIILNINSDNINLVYCYYICGKYGKIVMKT